MEQLSDQRTDILAFKVSLAVEILGLHVGELSRSVQKVTVTRNVVPVFNQNTHTYPNLLRRYLEETRGSNLGNYLAVFGVVRHRSVVVFI